MTNTFESSFVFRPDVRVIVHSADRVELRSGVWNCNSITLSDEEEKGILGKIVLGLFQKKSVAELTHKEHISNEEALSVIESLAAQNLLITKEDADTWSPTNFLSTSTLGTAKEMRTLPKRAIVIGPPTMTDFLRTAISPELRDAIHSVEEDVVKRLRKQDLFLDSTAFDMAKTASVFSEWQDALIVAVWPEIDPILLGNLNQLAHKVGFMLLSAVIDGPFALIGPTVVPHQTPCFACAEARVLEALRDHTLYIEYRTALAEGKVHGADAETIEPLRATTLSLAAWEVTNMLSVGSSFTTGKLLSIYAPTMEIAFHELWRFPGCPVCSARAGLDRQLYSDLRSYLSSQLGERETR